MSTSDLRRYDIGDRTRELLETQLPGCRGVCGGIAVIVQSPIYQCSILDIEDWILVAKFTRRIRGLEKHISAVDTLARSECSSRQVPVTYCTQTDKLIAEGVTTENLMQTMAMTAKQSWNKQQRKALSRRYLHEKTEKMCETMIRNL